VTTTCNPATGNTDASTGTTYDVSIVLSCRHVRLKPLHTSSKRKHWRHATFSSAGKPDSTENIVNEPLSYVTESVVPVGENESWKVMSFM